MLTQNQEYRVALNLEIDCVRSAVAHDPLADETTQARLDLLVAIAAYEDSVLASHAAYRAAKEVPDDEDIRLVGEAVDKRSAAGAVLKGAFKKLNVLEGKKPYAEREVLGVQWSLSKGNIPHRF